MRNSSNSPPISKKPNNYRIKNSCDGEFRFNRTDALRYIYLVLKKLQKNQGKLPVKHQLFLELTQDTSLITLPGAFAMPQLPPLRRPP
jgi:hypothetical protein